MWESIKHNIEWVFSGVGVMILTLLIAFFNRKRKIAKTDGKTNTQTLNGSSVNNSTLNNFNAEAINYQHNIYNETKAHGKDDEPVAITSDDLVGTKEDFLLAKKRLRTFIYRILIPARNTKNRVEIRNITDAVEEKLELAPSVVVNELKEMAQEGLIEFEFERQPEIVSPYTRVLLRTKFFSTIKCEKS
ncbi:MAG: hypothetical protein EOO12_01570 [Chitinophagaceae bacterium]|nr:MAG: hypothetical protein EOO12_01570 [Chitinophagaceae bacterium]